MYPIPPPKVYAGPSSKAWRHAHSPCGITGMRAPHPEVMVSSAECANPLINGQARETTSVTGAHLFCVTNALDERLKVEMSPFLL